MTKPDYSPIMLQDLSMVDSDGGQINLTSFGAELRNFLQREDVLDILPGYGWLDGGCLVLARALHTWGEGSLRMVAWARPLLRDPVWTMMEQAGVLMTESFDMHGAIASRFGASADSVFADHYAVMFDSSNVFGEGCPHVILDGDGMGTREDFTHKMRRELCSVPDNSKGFFLADSHALSETRHERASHSEDGKFEKLVTNTIDKVRKEFGSFNPNILGLQKTDFTLINVLEKKLKILSEASLTSVPRRRHIS